MPPYREESRLDEALRKQGEYENDKTDRGPPDLNPHPSLGNVRAAMRLLKSAGKTIWAKVDGTEWGALVQCLLELETVEESLRRQPAPAVVCPRCGATF